jgi:predicted DsbA family dithiol-disulfide isomerase
MLGGPSLPKPREEVLVLRLEVTVVMERTTVKTFGWPRLATALMIMLLLVLTQCVCSKGAMDASGNSQVKKPSKGAASETATKKSATKKETKDAKKSAKKAGIPLAQVLDVKDLDAYELADLEGVLKDQFDPCGKPISFRESLAKKGPCDRAIKMGNFVVDLIAKGLSKKMIVLEYHKELKRLASRFEFTLDGSPSIGDLKSKNVIVEFTDFQCPHCERVSEPLKKMAQKYGAVLYIKHLPLQIHPAARDAAKASLAAHAQGKFWEVYGLFFKNQDALAKESIRKFAEKAGLDMKRFDKDVASKEVDALIKRDEQEADMAVVEGTPTIFLNGYMVEMEELEDRLKNAK